jgi:hypothetical protein
MLSRLYANWVYGGFLAALMLFALTPVLASGWSPVLLLLWLQLPVYILHQYEEHDADRFRMFINANIGGGQELLTRFAVFVINIVGVWAVVAGAFSLAAQARIGLGLIAVYLSLINGVGHCLMAVAMRRYNPGLVTAILLFIPLGIATLRVMADVHDITPTDHIIGFTVALMVHAGIIGLIVVRKRQLAPPAERTSTAQF